MHVLANVTPSYDIEALQVLNFVAAHKDDVNTVAWDNRDISHIVYTGSDDCYIFVWDRRTLGKSKKPEGVLVGHQEGITNISSQGDSVHLISNGKDQVLKYWDIRKKLPIAQLKSMPPLKRQKDFDYRHMHYKKNSRRHPLDESIADFKGHSVLQTLIRCDFSPLETTGQKYIYTGSASGSVFIYDVASQKKVSELELYAEDEPGLYEETGKPIRDVSWHPKYPLIAATAFDGSIYLWDYKVNGKTNRKFNDLI